MSQGVWQVVAKLFNIVQPDIALRPEGFSAICRGPAGGEGSHHRTGTIEGRIDEEKAVYGRDGVFGSGR
ncbi:hypothetical protein NKI41_31170 [Mesorhizobium sp. M0601]|uniref:hypothetical protein n=1 Tax=Mesorhizobium sp. M0601 TaxID=2956969 RepID=UPI00333DF9D4